MQASLVLVYWNDAHGKAPGWADELSPQDLVHQPMPIITVGWLLKDDALGVSIACEKTSGDTYRGHTFVPRHMVRGITVIRKRVPDEPKQHDDRRPREPSHNADQPDR